MIAHPASNVPANLLAARAKRSRRHRGRRRRVLDSCHDVGSAERDIDRLVTSVLAHQQADMAAECDPASIPKLRVGERTHAPPRRGNSGR